MKLDDYKKLFQKAGDKDKAPEALSELLKAVTEDVTTLEALTQAHADDEKKIRDLQDTNMKLFLAQTGQREEVEEEKPVTPVDIANDMFSEEKGDK